MSKYTYFQDSNHIETNDGDVLSGIAALVFEQERTADALERIAAALEAGRDDPDAYEYESCNVSEIDTMRANGWRVLCMSTEYGSISLRRPRQQDAPENDPIDDDPDEPLDYPGEWGE